MFACKETVVGDIVMGKHDSLGESGRARCILHVDHIVTVHLALCLCQVIILHIASQKENLRSIVHSAVFFLSDVDDILHPWEILTLEISPLTSPELRKHGIYHVHEIIAATVTVDNAKRVHIGVLAEIFQLRLLVIGIYSHSHRTDLRTCIKKCEPVRYIPRPYAHMGTSFDSYGKKSFGHIVYTFIEMTPCETEIAV